MPMHPTTTHAAADHCRQEYRTEAAAQWHRRPEAARPAELRALLLWRVSTALDGGTPLAHARGDPDPAQ